MAKTKPKAEKPSGGKGKERPDIQKLVGQTELLTELYEIRVIEQVSWAELAENEYPKLTDGDTIDWRTLRQAMLRESLVIVPEMVNRTQKKVIDSAWDKIDMLKMIMIILKARFEEWNLLHDRRIKSLIDEGIIKFESKDLARLDFLTNEITGFFFKSAGIMTDLRGLISPMGSADGNTPLEIEGQVGQAEDGAITKADLKAIVESVASQSQEMLNTINLKHKDEGRGHYRPIAIDDDHDDTEA